MDQVTDMMVANAYNLIVTIKPANQRNTLTRGDTAAHAGMELHLFKTISLLCLQILKHTTILLLTILIVIMRMMRRATRKMRRT